MRCQPLIVCHVGSRSSRTKVLLGGGGQPQCYTQLMRSIQTALGDMRMEAFRCCPERSYVCLAAAQSVLPIYPGLGVGARAEPSRVATLVDCFQVHMVIICHRVHAGGRETSCKPTAGQSKTAPRSLDGKQPDGTAWIPVGLQTTRYQCSTRALHTDASLRRLNSSRSSSSAAVPHNPATAAAGDSTRRNWP